jgi:predicted Na+-dependent transporter
MDPQEVIGIVARFYPVANLGSMGLELELGEKIQSLPGVRVLGLTLGWSWIVGPALAVLLTKFLPLDETYTVGLLIFTLAPTAPAMPLFIRIAKADMSLAAAIMPLAVVGTVILMPLRAPLLIPELTVSRWAIGKPLLLTVPLPLIVGMAAAAYFLGFGLKQAQRSAMALGVCSRNGGAMFVAITAFPNLNPRLMVMILLAVPVPVIAAGFSRAMLPPGPTNQSKE